MIYLLTAIGLSPGGRSTVHIYTQTIHRTIQNKKEKYWDSGVITPEMLNYNARDDQSKLHFHCFSPQFFQSNEVGGRYVDKSPGNMT